MTMPVTLHKFSDPDPASPEAITPPWYFRSRFQARDWTNTIRLAGALLRRFGDDSGVSLYERLADNHLTALRDTFRGPGYVNLPTLPKGAGRVLTRSEGTPDYADGYGGTYSVGE